MRKVIPTPVLMVAIVGLCSALSAETIAELERRLDDFILEFTSNVTKSEEPPGLPENTYAPKYRSQKKVEILQNYELFMYQLHQIM